MKFRLALITLLLFPLLMTNVAAQKARGTAPDYFPLRVGDSWTYLHNEGSTFTIKVVEAKKQADGTTRYKVEMHSGNEIHYWYSNGGGWVLLHHKSYVGQEGVKVDYDPGRPYLKNPLVAGASWRWAGKGEIGQDITESHQVIGLETVKVKAGTFRAMKVMSEVTDGGAIIKKTNWYADGVGWVKSMSEGNGLKYGWELSDYSFKKTGPKR